MSASAFSDRGLIEHLNVVGWLENVATVIDRLTVKVIGTIPNSTSSLINNRLNYSPIFLML